MARTKRFARGSNLHVCGLYYVVPGQSESSTPSRQYLPQLSLSAKAKIISSTSRTTLTQTFLNSKSEAIPELRYTFPLYDGVSVVGFVCTINGDRVIRGLVKERAEARKTYKAAVDRGETAGLLEQLPEASDVFTTTLGNVPANATLEVEITYLGELKHDAEVDGIRFTIPTKIAPRYGNYPGEVLQADTVDTGGGISIVVDVEMPDGSNVKNVQSPSHPISVTLGNTSTGTASGADMSLQKASATLALSTTELGADFVLQVVATNTGNPIAVLETHPTLPNHRALMATLVPKFNLPSSRPEIVFLCDRSGSMGGKIPNLQTALRLFLKSLPVAVKFNICSFGSHHEFLFKDGSRTYDQSSLEEATRYVDTFAADFGGTDIHDPMEDAFKKRYTDMDLEVYMLTDGEIWDQEKLFEMVNKHIAESDGRIRVFSLGIGSDASHSLIEGVAAAGNGFSQSVGDKENMNSKVVRMLKASLTPHIKDYTLEVKYNKDAAADSADDFEIVEKVMDALSIDVQEPETKEEAPQKPISLFDESANPDVDMTDASLDTSAGGKYSHVPLVAEPKFLQVPFVVPALYPFNRTTVYVLMSPETAQKQPKSVVLRGTSQHGPVELEIPVTVLADKGETIHQLAARKAVKELEDGRGWIYHAKDATDPAGALLKDKYPGRFKDMVEREAVRLGVTYQVGGKWCSFVAVDDANDDDDESAKDEAPQQEQAARPRRSYAAGTPAPRRQLASKACRKSAPTSSAPDPAQAYPTDAVYGRGTLPPGTTSAQGFSSTSYSASSPPPRAVVSPRMMMSASAAAPATVLASASYRGLGKGGVKRHRKIISAPVSSEEEEEEEEEDESDDDAGFSMASAGPAKRTRGLGYGGIPRNRAGPVSRFMVAASDEDEDEDEDEDSDEGVAAPVDLAALGLAEKLNRLVSLQGFSGAWTWEEKVVGLLGLGEGVVVPEGLGGQSDVLATAMVVVFLEEGMQGMRDEWEMLVDKARGWLEGEVSGKTVEEYCEAVKGFLKAQGVLE